MTIEIKNINIGVLFDNLKDGDDFGFWREGIFSRIIKFFQKKDNVEGEDLASSFDYNKISHLGRVFNVLRFAPVRNGMYLKECITFNFGEQTLFYGGQFAVWKLEKTKYNGDDCIYRLYRLDKKPIKQDNLYWKKFNKPLTAEQQRIGIEDQKNIVGKVYGFAKLPFTIPFVSKYIAKYFKKGSYIPWFSSARVCSGNLRVNDYKMSRLTEEEYLSCPYPTPERQFFCNKNDSEGEYFNIVNFKSIL